MNGFAYRAEVNANVHDTSEGAAPIRGARPLRTRDDIHTRAGTPCGAGAAFVGPSGRLGARMDVTMKYGRPLPLRGGKMKTLRLAAMICRRCGGSVMHSWGVFACVQCGKEI